MKYKLDIYTDGACSGNPGKGGWGAIIMMGDCLKELSGFNHETTNNQMEMTAVIKALKAIKEPVEATITTDSKYVIDGFTKWLPNWKKNSWKTADKKPVKNKELWVELDELSSKHKIDWKWIKGHAGHEFNERCDYLARKQIEEN